MEDAPSTPTREPRRESRGSTPRGAVTLLGSPVTKAAGGGATPRSPRPRATTLAEPPSVLAYDSNFSPTPTPTPNPDY